MLNAWEPAEPVEDDETAGAVEAARVADDADAASDSAESEIAEDVVAGDTDVADAAEAGPELEGDSGEGWVRGDGENNIPEGFPVKGNASSRIYHTPESRSYDNTIAEYYFASAEVAESPFRTKGMKSAGGRRNRAQGSCRRVAALLALGRT